MDSKRIGVGRWVWALVACVLLSSCWGGVDEALKGAITLGRTLIKNGEIRGTSEAQLEDMARVALASQSEVATGIKSTQSKVLVESESYFIPKSKADEITNTTKTVICDVNGSAFDAWQPGKPFLTFESYLTHTYTNTLQPRLRKLISPRYIATRQTVSELIKNYNDFMKKCTRDHATCKETYVLAANLACAAP
jgi:hypothetical protein